MTTAADDTLTAEALDSITVETATSTPEELVAHLAAGTDAPPEAEVVEAPVGDKAPVVEELPPKPGAAPAEEPPKPASAAADTRSEFEKQVDELDPPLSDETPKQRAERMSRGERRILQLLHRAKGTEADLQAAHAEITRLKAAPAGTKVEPPAVKVELPPFSFSTWDQYSEQHPEATHEEYIDARTDARRDWHTTNDRLTREAAAAERDAAQRRQALETLDREKFARIEEYRTANRDYDAAMQAVADLPLPPDMHIAMAMSPIGPKIAHYLALHRDEHLRIVNLPPARMLTEIGKLESKLEGDTPITSPAATAGSPPPAGQVASSAAPAAATTARVAVPSRPTSSAPAPASEVTGRAQPTRSLQAIAEADGEDGTGYMLHRMKDRKELGLRG